MAIVDERGRLFGRFNVFDAIIAVLALWLIPIAYGAYLLYRAPTPTLTAIEPSTIIYDREMEVRVRGTNFAPYLRVSFGRYQVSTFKFNDTTDAYVGFTNIPPGTYDAILFDNSQERDRIPNALTILPSALPAAKLTAVGNFGNLTAEQASTITAGMTIAGIGVVEHVGKPVPQLQRVFVRPGNHVEVPIDNAQMLPAVVRLSCFIRSAQGQPECVTGFSVQPATLLFFDMPFARQVPFQIDQVRSVHPLVPVPATVRFAGDPQVLAHVKAGDQDYGEFRNELGLTARIDSVEGGGSARDARLTIYAQRGADSWLYQNAPLRLGGSFVFRSERYEVRGTVIALDAPRIATQ
ncbi:MAG TPA: DUF4330 family protein [Vicinamibacterales bacterium]|nr:DUF4330 family protein [Vicinamibacterales bacterium]